MLADLERLIELQDIESRSGAAAKAIAEAPGRIAALESILKAANAALDAARKSLEDNKTHRRSIDKDLIADQQRLDKYKEQIMAVKTNEQLHAMQHQMKAVEDDILKQEERVLVNMMEADEVNAAIKKAEAGLKAAQAKMTTERGVIESEMKTNEATVAECTAARAKLIAAMNDKNVVDTFQRIAKVRGTAVARAEGERCTVCQVRLRPAVFVHVLKNDRIVQCDSCNRILYFVPPAAARPQEEASSGGASPQTK